MGDGFQFFDIILFAMIAAFLVLRLRSVLGRRDGHDGSGHRDPFSRRQTADKKEDNVIPLPDKTGADIEPDVDVDIVDAPAADNGPLAKGVRDIQRVDPSFTVKEFLSGAKIAFEMILASFAKGDRGALKPLLSPDVFANFEKAIKDREDAEETLDYTLIGIKSADALEVYMEGTAAHLTVKFVSEQVNAIKDKDGKVIDGDPDRIVEVTDFWTFSRDTKSRNPNWTLTATRSLE
ncbi:MAG: Tim44/TimA family putative adaptor protein [Rhodospirillales bacterium]